MCFRTSRIRLVAACVPTAPPRACLARFYNTNTRDTRRIYERYTKDNAVFADSADSGAQYHCVRSTHHHLPLMWKRFPLFLRFSRTIEAPQNLFCGERRNGGDLNSRCEFQCRKPISTQQVRRTSFVRFSSIFLAACGIGNIALPAP